MNIYSQEPASRLAQGGIRKYLMKFKSDQEHLVLFIAYIVTAPSLEEQQLLGRAALSLVQVKRPLLTYL